MSQPYFHVIHHFIENCLFYVLTSFFVFDSNINCDEKSFEFFDCPVYDIRSYDNNLFVKIFFVVGCVACVLNPILFVFVSKYTQKPMIDQRISDDNGNSGNSDAKKQDSNDNNQTQGKTTDAIITQDDQNAVEKQIVQINE